MRKYILVEKANSLEELLKDCQKNQTIGDNLVIAWAKINSPLYKKIVCSISGGSDSDIMLDIIWRCDKDNKVDYVWFDTGLEYQATKEHLKYLENKYNIMIRVERAIKPIPVSCKTYGQPFISKNVSEMISRLQRHNFKWEDKSYEELLKEYCVWDEKQKKWIGCSSALSWWCNINKSPRFCIKFNKWLKEFMIMNPPKMEISSKCCLYAKKNVIHKLLSSGEYDLNVSGIRKYEGGIRGTAYKSCFDDNGNGFDNYRPLFWYTNADKEDYKTLYVITNSDCYTKYGLKRTGCAGCPFGRDFEFELKTIKEHEPKLFKAVNNIFGESYEYTRKYREFCQAMNIKEKEKQNQWEKII